MNRPARILICCVGTLMALGTVMIFSILGARGSSLAVGVHYLFKHLIWVAIAAGGFFVASRVDYRLLRRFALPVALIVLLLLVMVLLPQFGTHKFGARRWLRMGPIGFQPSEAAKLALIVVLAAIFSGGWAERPRGLLAALGVVALTSALVLAEKDFGTCALLGMLGFMVIIAAGGAVLPTLGTGALGAGGLAFLLTRSPTRMARVLAFLDPWAHQDAAGYQALQSLTALGSGGLVGRVGMQKLFFLPQAETDFIYAVVGEELGLLGALGVLAIFLVIVRQGMRISEAAPDAFGRIAAFGITAMIALQALMHIAVVTVSMPTKGIALPFVSSGGSALFMGLVGVGILINIAQHCPAEAFAAESVKRPRRAGGFTRRSVEVGAEL